MIRDQDLASLGSDTRVKKAIQNKDGDFLLPALILLPACTLTQSLHIHLKNKMCMFIFENSLGVKPLCPAENTSK